MAKLLDLTQGYAAFVDDAVYPYISSFRWRVRVSKYTQYAYNNNKLGYLHRFLLFAPKGVIVDHKNLNGLDNRLENLRLVTRGQNSQNRAVRAQSGIKGVYQVKDKYVSQIQVNGKNIYLGRFDFPEEAGERYDEAAKQYFGPDSWVNYG